ncbi:hypothetical protein CAEBREN_29767, partial [Caenorhabditis brenneri]
NIFQESRPTSSLSMYQNDVILSRPGSAASNYTTASTVNPTILAGASFSKPSSHIRQPVSHRPAGVQTGTLTSASGSVSNAIRSSIGSSSVTARVPNTLARVLLKKELKDVLNQRKQRLEATEIEANQRHYKVQRMLITGLLPEKTDDDIPNVVKCGLPADLVRGVHISMQPPSPAVSAFSPRRYHPTPTKRTTVLSSQPSSSSYKHMSKSIACQADELPPVKPMVSLRNQLDMERRPQLMTYVGKRSAETQTEFANYETMTPTVRYGSMPRSSRERSASRRYREQQQQIYNQMPQNHNDFRMRQMEPMNQSYAPNQYHHHMTLLAPKPATMTHVAPTYNQLAQQQGLSMQNTQMDPLMMTSRIPPTSSQVYSRNEMNYGSRPAQSSLFEYGNNRRQYGGIQAPTYDVPNVSSQPDWRSTQGSMHQMSIPMQQNNTFDARWPKEDALSRMYATASRRRAQETALASSSKISTGSRNYARRPIRPSSYRNPQATNSMPDRHVARRSTENGKYDVKKILLTRSYKHHNIYNGIYSREFIKKSDEVVEWNGILLRGKTFEEVERIVNKSHGEIEMVIRTEKNPSSGYYDTLPSNRSNTLRDDLSPDRVPPVPMHRINGINNNSVLHHHTLSDSSCHGHIQVSLGYDGNSRLVAKIIRARGLRSRDQSRSAPNPFVKVYLLPGRKVSHKRRTRFVDSSCAPEWNQVLEYQVAPHTLNTMFLEFTVCDYQRDVDDLPLGSVQIPLADKSAINSGPRWYPLQGSFEQQAPQHHSMNGTSQIQSIAAASTHAPVQSHYPNHNYSEVPPSILYPKGGLNARHPDKPVRHATFNYNPVSLDIGYPAIN